MLNFRNFKDSDYLGYAGAERFADGSEPKIATLQLAGDKGKIEADIVYDANGLQIMGYDENDNEFALNYSEKSPAKIKAVLRALGTGNVTLTVLKELGFNNIFGESATKINKLITEGIQVLEGLAIGDKVRIKKEYGGGTGEVADFAPSGKYVIVKTKGGNKSFNLADVVKVEE